MTSLDDLISSYVRNNKYLRILEESVMRGVEFDSLGVLVSPELTRSGGGYEVDCEGDQVISVIPTFTANKLVCSARPYLARATDRSRRAKDDMIKEGVSPIEAAIRGLKSNLSLPSIKEVFLSIASTLSMDLPHNLVFEYYPGRLNKRVRVKFNSAWRAEISIGKYANPMTPYSPVETCIEIMLSYGITSGK